MLIQSTLQSQGLEGTDVFITMRHMGRRDVSLGALGSRLTGEVIAVPDRSS